MGSCRAKTMLLAFTLGLGSPAGALTFSFTDAGGAALGTSARTGYQIAADY